MTRLVGRHVASIISAHGDREYTVRSVKLISAMQRWLPLAMVMACRHEPPIEEPLAFTARVIDAGTADLSQPRPIVQVEVKARVIDAKADRVAGTTIVTVAIGANHGVGLDWIGEVVDEAGTHAGGFTVIDVKERTTIGASPLSPKALERKLVRLSSPR